MAKTTLMHIHTIFGMIPLTNLRMLWCYYSHATPSSSHRLLSQRALKRLWFKSLKDGHSSRNWYKGGMKEQYKHPVLGGIKMVSEAPKKIIAIILGVISLTLSLTTVLATISCTELFSNTNNFQISNSGNIATGFQIGITINNPGFYDITTLNVSTQLNLYNSTYDVVLANTNNINLGPFPGQQKSTAVFTLSMSSFNKFDPSILVGPWQINASFSISATYLFSLMQITAIIVNTTIETSTGGVPWVVKQSKIFCVGALISFMCSHFRSSSQCWPSIPWLVLRYREKLSPLDWLTSRRWYIGCTGRGLWWQRSRFSNLLRQNTVSDEPWAISCKMSLISFTFTCINFRGLRT